MIAESVKSNIRELEGSLVKLVASSSVQGVPITTTFAAEILKDMLKPTARTISVDDIKQVISKQFKIAPETLVGRKRTSQIALPRQVAMYITRMLTNMSLADIGASLRQARPHHGDPRLRQGGGDAEDRPGLSRPWSTA